MSLFDDYMAAIVNGTFDPRDAQVGTSKAEEQALLVAYGQKQVGVNSNSSGGVVFYNPEEFTFGAYRYFVLETNVAGNEGVVNRWEVNVGSAGSSAWSGTKPTTQAQLEALTYS